MARDASFYEVREGKLVEVHRHPPLIKSCLEQEERVLDQLKRSFTTIVEVGCLDGRLAVWAAEAQKRYLGLDQESQVLWEARVRVDALGAQQARFEYCNPRLLYQTICNRKLLSSCEVPLFVFPFNSFGSLERPEETIAGLVRLKVQYLIFSFGVDERSTRAREQYYRNYCHSGLKTRQYSEGVRFVSNNGLNTVAYDPEVMRQMFYLENGERVLVYRHSDVGLCYSRPPLNLPLVSC